MKTSFTTLLLYIFLLSTVALNFTSCHKQHDDEVVKETGRNLNYYIYEYTTNVLSKENYENKYIPDSLKNLLCKAVIKEGCFFSVYELLFINHNSKGDFIIYPSVNNIYDCHSDNSNWVDGLLTSMEESRIGQELEKMENIINSPELNGNQEDNAVEVEKIIKEADNQEKIELLAKEIKDINDSLVSMEYGDEIFIPKKNGNNWILIHSSGSSVKRFFYDSIFRCYREEHWDIKSGNEEKLKTTIETDFRVNSYIPLTRTEIYEDRKVFKNFNSNGFMIKEDEYIILEDKDYIKESLELKYNDDNKVIESSLTEYSYKDSSLKDLDYTFNKKYLYKYNIDDIPPDFVYYENGSLKIRNHYVSKGDYTSEIFFSDDYTVTSAYKDNKLVKEIFTLKGGEKRIKSYEK